MKYYGVSTGDTGRYGVGDIVVGEKWGREENGGGFTVDDEPCYNVFIVKEGGIEYVDVEGVF